MCELQIDESPVDGKVFDREALEELSKEGVTLVSLLRNLIHVSSSSFPPKNFLALILSFKIMLLRQ